MPNSSGEHGAEDQEPVDVDLSVATAVDNPAEQSPKLFGYQGLRLCLRIGPVPFSSAPVRYAGPDAPGKSCPVLEHAATPEPMLAERLIVWKILASRLQCVFRLERPPRLWVSA